MNKAGLTKEQRLEAAAFIRHALEVATVQGTALNVYRALLDKMNWTNRTAFRSRADLIKDTGISDRQLDRVLKRLRDTGHIKAVAYARGGRGMAPVYIFMRAQMIKKGVQGDKANRREQNKETTDKTTDKTPDKTPAKMADPSPSFQKERKEERDKATAGRREGDKVREINGRNLYRMQRHEVAGYLAKHGWTERDLTGMSDSEIATMLEADGYYLNG